MSYKGRFTPKYPQKYRGKVNDIVYRSNWELRVMKWLDENSSIIWWSSEELIIRYKSPIDQRIHRYFPDFVIHTRKKDGNEKTMVIEIKPYKQTQKPTQKRKTKTYLEEAKTYIVNQEKWKAADIFCQEHGWQFIVLTEKDLGIR
jgi:macrodomain Ter protein organizer (MatP/YcbG family)